SHPGAVIVLDDDVTEGGDAFLVMELLRGQSVEALWERLHGHLPMPLVAGIGVQLLEVLAAAHSRQLTHRDIKPANLLLTHEGQIKVLDFGIARVRDAASSHATQTGMVLGTPAFMAPEHAMAKSDEIDAQTDVWAAGATLFTLACGDLVHNAENAQQILIRAATKPARSLAAVLPSVPESIGKVIDRALEFEKAQRWPSASAMCDALKIASVEAFGSVPTAARMSEILDEVGADEATAERAAAAVVVVVDENTTAPAPASEGAAMTPPHAPAPAPSHRGPFARPSAPGVGFITEEAVSTESILLRRRVRSREAVAAALAVVALGIGGTVLLTRAGSAPEGVSAVRPIAQTTADSAAVSVAPLTPAPAPVALAPAASEVTRAPTVKVHAKAAAAAERAPLTPVSAPAARPKTDCNPPYEFDAMGTKRWKRQCL
ncbi:MAG: serine/threonine-protein kinase, partial [Polyangiaceae bacterium]